MIFRRKQGWPDRVTTPAGDGEVEVDVRVNARSRSYRLTIASSGKAVLTVPPHGRWIEAERFLRKQDAWLAARLKRAPQLVPFAEGAEIPLRGEPHVIAGTGRLRGQVIVEAGEDGDLRLLVPGGPEHMARRLTDWLKAEALKDLEICVARHTARLGVKATGIRVRGQTSRWGSCASTGKLNFNWKLILTPPHVLDYVAAHEVAHLVEMNHSAAFWATVEKTLPDMERGRAWLKAHGRQVMAYGSEG